MHEPTTTEPTLGEMVLDLATFVAGLGMIVMMFFPFALPALVLAAAAGVVLLPVLALALAAAVVAAPILAVRRLRRRIAARRDRVPELRPAPRAIRS